MWTISNWTITADSSEDPIVNGNRFMTGNGYLGYRGTLDESTAKGMCATIVNGLYDQHGDTWREPVNLPNGLFVSVSPLGKETLSVSKAKGRDALVNHEQSLDFRYGIHSRLSEWNVEDTTIRIRSERFASMDNPHLLVLRFVLVADRDIPVKISRGVDGAVYDINGPHLGSFRPTIRDDLLGL